MYFEYYFNRIKCKYNINVNLDITKLLKRRQELNIKFFPTMLYVIMKAIHNHQEFRMSFNENGELGYWEEVVACYTLFHPETETFTEIWSEYSPSFEKFYQTICADMVKYGKTTDQIKGRPDQPANFCSISNLPWLSFTGFGRDTYAENKLLYPVVTLGKYFNEGNKVLLPFSILVSHAVADGYHTCRLIKDITDMIEKHEEWMHISTLQM